MKDFKFEERACKNKKCKLSFRVLVGSPQEYHAESCRMNDDAKFRRNFLGNPEVVPEKEKAGE